MKNFLFIYFLVELSPGAAAAAAVFKLEERDLAVGHEVMPHLCQKELTLDKREIQQRDDSDNISPEMRLRGNRAESQQDIGQERWGGGQRIQYKTDQVYYITEQPQYSFTIGNNICPIQRDKRRNPRLPQ